MLSEILRLLSELDGERYPFGAVADRLDENWQSVLERRWPGVALAEQEALLEAVRPIVHAFTELLLAHADFAPWGAVAADELDPAIPWSRGDHTDLRAYDAEMASLTGYALAQKRAPRHALSVYGNTSVPGLRMFLTGWGDEGGTGASRGTDATPPPPRSNT